MNAAHRWVVRAYWCLTLALLAGALVVAVRAPGADANGPIQKLIYLHLPVAINALLSAAVVFVACVGYLGGHRQPWDDLAQAAARVTVLNATVLLLTGVCWARVAWGHWWVWSPRLVFSLLLWLLYAGYLAMRPLLRPLSQRAIVSAVYGAIAFLDVPLVYLSVKLLPDIHPATIDLAPETARIVLLWLVPITMINGGLIAARYGLARRAAGALPPSMPTGPGPRVPPAQVAP